MEVLLGMTVIAAAIGLGGGLYEFTVIDPYWPKRLDLIQPEKGGVSRRHFWISAHIVFEVLLVLSLVFTWRQSDVRTFLLVAFASHALMRIWSAFDFIPKALAFEKAQPSEAIAEDALTWTRRSRLRFPFDLLTCGTSMSALLVLVKS